MEQRLFDDFENLRKAIQTFNQAIKDGRTIRWLAPWHQLNHHADLSDILFDLWYEEDQDGRETRLYPGLVGVPREHMLYANEINSAKDRFRKTVNEIKESDSIFWREVQGRLAKRYKMLNDRLSQEGLARIHLKQVFRHIPLLVQRPEKIGFSWYTSGRSIKKIDVKTAYNMLCKLNTDSPHVKIQLDRLASLPSTEPLARVQAQAPVLRANVIFANKSRRAMNVSLPILFPHEGLADLPDFNIPPETPPSVRQRLVRSDNKLEDDAFLPSIRVHRYAQKQKPKFL